MNEALERLAREVHLDADANERMRLQFGYACAVRVRHLLEQAEVLECLAALGAFLSGAIARTRLDVSAERASWLATRHPGSKSIDGCGHAAVSATYAVAKALNGDALQAASYAAYARVYAEGGHGAVADPESFDPEFHWQVSCLAELAMEKGR